MAYVNPAAGAARERYTSAGAPAAGTNEVQTVTLGGTPTGGSFALGFKGFSTAAIPWSGVNATLLAAIDAALEALPTIGAGGVTCAATTLTAGIGAFTVTFSGANVQRRAQPNMTVAGNSLTGTAPTVGVAETTPGVDASGAGAPPGSMLTRTDTGAMYQQNGTAAAPNWVAI